MGEERVDDEVEAQKLLKDAICEKLAYAFYDLDLHYAVKLFEAVDKAIYDIKTELDAQMTR